MKRPALCRDCPWSRMRPVPPARRCCGRPDRFANRRLHCGRKLAVFWPLPARRAATDGLERLAGRDLETTLRRGGQDTPRWLPVVDISRGGVVLEGEVNYPAATDTTIEIAGVNQPIAARIAARAMGRRTIVSPGRRNVCVDRQGLDGCR